ncbi:DUF6232 family protein [Paraburkholderia sp. GAS334]|uniref:DUF6232 family protein n=1 Tax=Paraburkholderia sp. GAS334 TaxID=3035131 RepID=UPI003D20D188
MEERTFLDEGGVKVTNARVLVGSQTYAMSGVTSVKHAVEPASRTVPVVCFLVAVATLYFDHQDTNPILFAIAVAVVGILLWVLVKDKHFVILHSSSGESRAVTHTDRGFIHRVIQAINNSIISRG